MARQPSIKPITRPSLGSPASSNLAAAATPVPAHSPAATAPIQNSPVPVPPAAYPQSHVASPQVYSSTFQRRASNFATQTPASYQGPSGSHSYGAIQSPYASYQANRMHVPTTAGLVNPNAPRPIEVFHLSDAANTAIPADIREQFHTDDRGRVLFFSSVPLDVASSTQQTLGHSLKYLATKEEHRSRVEDRKRKLAHENEERVKSAKCARAGEGRILSSQVESLTNRAVQATADQIVTGTNALYEALYQDRAESAKLSDIKARERAIIDSRAIQAQTAQIQAASTRATFVNLRGNAIYIDDIDPTS